LFVGALLGEGSLALSLLLLLEASAVLLLLLVGDVVVAEVLLLLHGLGLLAVFSDEDLTTHDLGVGATLDAPLGFVYAAELHDSAALTPSIPPNQNIRMRRIKTQPFKMILKIPPSAVPR